MRISLGIEYDGTLFHGFQIQPQGLRTVQCELEKALSFVANESVELTCAGRTDAGVHAIEQVVHFDTHAVREEKAWVFGVNANLPKDIAVKWSKVVSNDFHARFSALSRTYRYVIINQPMHFAIQRNYAAWCHYPLNEKWMEEAAADLIGEHDFSSFRSSECQSKTAFRCVKKIEIQRTENQITIEITANAFLHHMVRNMVGTLMVIGTGKKQAKWAKTLLSLKNRNQGDTMAPAHGLYLLCVEY